MRKETMEYSASLDIAINTGYGMSNLVLAATFSTPIAHQWGSCGHELAGCEVKIFRVENKRRQKEARVPPQHRCCRRPARSTRERSAGRFKKVIIGEGCENIAPVPIEDSIKGY